MFSILLTCVRRYHRLLFLLKHFLILVCVVLPSISTGADVEISATQTRYAVGKYIDYLVDSTGLLSVDDVTTPEYASQFIGSDQEVLNFGFTSSVYWIRLTLHNNTNNHTWILEQRFANTHFLDLYVPTPDNGGYQIRRSGNLRPFENRDIPYRRIVFKIDVPPGEKRMVVYLRMQTDAAMTIDLNLWTPDVFTEEVQFDTLFNGIFYGILLVMLFYNMFLYLFLRDISYVWLVSFIASILGMSLFYHGHAQMVFSGEWSQWSRLGLPWFFTLCLITFLQFTHVVLVSSSSAPIWLQLHRGLIIAYILLAVIVPLVSYKILALVIVPLSLITLVFAIVRGIYCLWLKDPVARWYLLSWSALIITVFLTVAVRVGILPSNIITENNYTFGIAWMVLFMSVALVGHIDRLKQRAENSLVALRNSESERQMIAKAGHLGLWSWNLTTNSVRWSAETEEIFGIPKDSFAGTFEAYRTFVHPDDLPKLEKRIQTSLDYSVPYSIEHRIVLPNGSTRWVSVYGRVESNENNRPISMHGTIQDITDYKLAQQELRDTEEIYKSIFNSAADGFVIRQIDGAVVDVNPAMCDMYGYTRSEYMRLKNSEHVHPDSLPLFDQFKQAIQRGETFYTDEAKGIRKDGTTFYLQIRANRIQYHGQPHAFVIARDVTEQKNAQEALKNIATGVSAKTGEEFFQQLVLHLAAMFEVQHIFIGTVDENDTQHIRTLAICSDKQLIDNRDFLISGSPCETVIGHSACAYTDNVQRKFPKDPYLAEMGAVSYYGMPLFDAQGQSLGLIALVDNKPMHKTESTRDILQIFATRVAAEIQRIKAERVIKLHRDHLEEMVEKRTAELQALNEELEAFSYSVSHDLRAPLRSIDGFSQIVLENASSALDVESKDYLNRVRQNAKQMAAIIDDLLQLARVTRLNMAKRAVNLSELVKMSIHKCQEQDQSREVEAHVAPDLYAQGDPALLTIAIDNMISNAWKYTRKTSHPEIEFGADERQGKIVYYIKDNGAGFDMHHADNLFRAFHRLHSEGDFEGTGIGLATVARIIQRHDGKIWADASVGHGATFYFDLNNTFND